MVQAGNFVTDNIIEEIV